MLKDLPREFYFWEMIKNFRQIFSQHYIKMVRVALSPKGC